MQETFPGLYVHKIDKLGGCHLSVDIWNFCLSVSLTEKVLSTTQDVIGEARVVFIDRIDTLRAVTVTTEDDFKEVLTWVVTYLYGVMGALEVAFQPKPEPPRTSILNELDSF